MLETMDQNLSLSQVLAFLFGRKAYAKAQHDYAYLLHLVGHQLAEAVAVLGMLDLDVRERIHDDIFNQNFRNGRMRGIASPWRDVEISIHKERSRSGRQE